MVSSAAHTSTPFLSVFYLYFNTFILIPVFQIRSFLTKKNNNPEFTCSSQGQTSTPTSSYCLSLALPHSGIQCLPVFWASCSDFGSRWTIFLLKPCPPFSPAPSSQHQYTQCCSSVALAGKYQASLETVRGEINKEYAPLGEFVSPEQRTWKKYLPLSGAFRERYPFTAEGLQQDSCQCFFFISTHPVHPPVWSDAVLPYVKLSCQDKLVCQHSCELLFSLTNV